MTIIIGNSGSIWLYHGLLSFDLDATRLQCKLLTPTWQEYIGSEYGTWIIMTPWETMYPINFVHMHPV